MDSLACNVVLIPSLEIAEKAVAISERLISQGVLFALAEGEFFPHVSVYMFQIKVEDIREVKTRLAQISTGQRSFDLQAIRYWQAKQFLDVEYEKTPSISALQDAVVLALNPLRDGMRARDMDRMKEASGLALANYQNYGWNTVGALYRPHLTLTRFTDDQDLSSLPLPNANRFSGAFTKLGLFEMGNNDTCVRKVMEFELQ